MLRAADNELLTRTSALADRRVPFAEVMVQRFGDAVGRVGRDPSRAQASSATYSSPRSSLRR